MTQQNILVEKIEGFARKFYLNRLIQGVLAGLVIWLLFYLILNALEYFSWFSSLGRLILFIFLLSGSLAVLAFYFVIPLVNLLRFRKRMTLDHAAVLIGRFFPDIEDKLLNTLQLSNAVNSDSDNELLLAAIEQRTASLQPVKFTDAVDLKGNLKIFAVFMSLLFILLILLLWAPDFSVQPTKRILNYEQHFVKPLPFHVELSSQSIETTQGSDVDFSIKVTGQKLPDAFYIQSALGRQMMNRISTNDFRFTFKGLMKDIDFQIVGGDYLSEQINIYVHPNPVLLSYNCDLSFPKYIHREDESLSGKSHIIVPQGTKIDFTFYTRDVDELVITIDSTDVALSESNDAWIYSFVAMQSFRFEVSVLNLWKGRADAMPFVVDVIADSYPDIQIETFQEDFSPMVYFSGLLTDDYGFLKLTFNYSLQNPDKENVILPVVFNNESSRASFFYDFNMDSIGLLPGQQIQAYFEVWDNDYVNGPKSKQSTVFTFDVPTKAMLDSVADQNEEQIMETLLQKAEDAKNIKDDIEKMLQDLISKKELDWTDKEKIKELLNKQNEVQQDWNMIQQEQRQLSEFLKDNNLENEELIKKQERINELFKDVIPEEMKKIMEQIEELLQEMPREKLLQLMQEMQNDNKKMMDLIDRNLALLEQLKLEKEMNDLLQKLDELANQLKDTSGINDSLSASDAQRSFEEMMKTLDSLEKKNQELPQPFDIEKDSELEEEISDDLDQANELEKEGNDSEAGKKKMSAGEKMKKMSDSMSMQMQMGGMGQMAEDAHLVRILLDNVVRSSHQQEALMNEVGALKDDNPLIGEKIGKQKDLADNFLMVGDSLKAMAIRQPMIQNFVFDQLNNIDRQTKVALKMMNEHHLNYAVRYQQDAIMAMNNLALMLAESLKDMEQSMEGSGTPKPNNKPSSGNKGQQSLQNMEKMQEQLGKKLKELQQQMQKQGGKTSSGMSEQFARMAAEQQMLRQSMQQMLEEMKKNGQLGNDGLNEIMKDMERLEEDMVNKRITNHTLQRNRNILSRMLEAEKAQEEREKEEKRKSNEYKGPSFNRSVDEQIFLQKRKRNLEFLKKNSIEYQPFYLDKINNYYMKKNIQ
jgi:hypothetical protein